MHSRLPWKIPHKGLLFILGSFILATLASIIFLSYTLLRLDSSISASNESYRSLRLLQTLLINLDEAETGARGYVITGNPEFLKPYDAAVKQVPETLSQLSAAEDNELSPVELSKLKKDASQRIVLLQQTVSAKAAGDEETVAERVASGQGNSLMQALRGNIKSHTESHLAAVRDGQSLAHDRMRRALSVAVASSVFVIGICAVIIWYFQRSILRERALENTKSEFLSLASHQLRTPATNVKQYVGLLLDGYLGQLTKKQRSALEIAYKNNESEIKIMNDLLDVAKLDLKRIQLRKQQINIVPVVKQVVKEFRPAAEAKGQKLQLRAPGEAIAMVDREYLKGVIEKLLDNAIRYSKDKTVISVKVRLFEAENYFEIVVRDQGLGIQKRELAKLFMKFSRISNEFSANSEGSGLGLYWVKQVMALHGGSVSVRSQEGRGSKFIIRAPLA